MAELENPTPVVAPVREDPPQPDLPDLQQREVYDVPAVPVCIDGTTDVHVVPNKRFSVSFEPIGASPIRVLTADPTRRRATLMLRSATATDVWTIMSASTGQGISWPANVPFIAEHCDEMWAKADTPTSATLGVAVENWAD